MGTSGAVCFLSQASRQSFFKGGFMKDSNRKVAYFSMEIGIDPGVPTYSGGLGILAGDTIRSAADLRVPMVVMTLLHRKGYFNQRLTAEGTQQEEPVEWPIQKYLEEMKERVEVPVEGRTVKIRAWKYSVKGVSDYHIPVYFLDADLPENSEWDRHLTDFLYGGDQHYRLCQEVILGIGGIRMLRALGFKDLERFHMNEGHSAFLTMELLDEQLKKSGHKTISAEDIEAVHRQCVFTTHTPVPAGHDKFSLDLARQVCGSRPELSEWQHIFCLDGGLNMTFLALNLSRFVNGVAKKHGEVARHMFAGYQIDSITNGVHAATWTSPSFQALYDRMIPGWREDNFNLRYAASFPKEDVWQAHIQAKDRLIETIKAKANVNLRDDIFTIGFARRSATYKRADLLFHDLNRLKTIQSKVGHLQIVYAGKAHPHDQGGKDLIKSVYRAKAQLAPDIPVVYLENYDMELGKIVTAGVDLWLNTPEPPMEASGTSGMKAALNGVPSLSILDGWWIEGCIEGTTGWAIGENGRHEGAVDRAQDAESLYQKLELDILPLFYRNRKRYIDVMLHAIAINGSFFNTQRMVQQYVTKAYFE